MSHALKIAIVGHLKYPISEPFAGGLEMHTHLLTQRLSTRGHKVALFAAEGSHGPSVLTFTAPTSGLASEHANYVDQIEVEAYEAMMDVVEAGDFDLIHFNALHPLPLMRSGLLQIPTVAVLHTPPFEPLANAVRSPQRNKTVVAVSANLRDQWDLNEETQVIHNGIDLARFRFVRSQKRKTAIWSGRIVPEKGPHLAIDAAVASEIPLDLAGPIIDLDYWAACIAPRLGDHVRYIGHLDQTRLADAVGHAAVCICTPRWEEPFGLVVAEALACGTPVAGFRRGALPDIVDSSSGALADADDVVGLAAAIRTCVKLDRNNCRARAERLFDAEVMIDRYEALYRLVIFDQSERISNRKHLSLEEVHAY
jgi:UDP-glucose:tetrahydrobiopterin glucosyltransferase